MDDREQDGSDGVIAVIGASGTLGREVVAALLSADRSTRLRAVVRDPAGASERLPAQVEARQGDLARPETLPAALEGARAVLLLCGHHPDQLTLERAGLAAAVRAGVSRVLYMSAAGDPVPALAADHRRFEDELAAIPDLDWAVLRPTAAYPSLLGGLCRLIGPDGAVPLAFGEARVNLVDARDVGAAAAVLLRDGAGRFAQDGDKRVFTLTGPRSFTGAELVAAAAEASGRRLTHRDLAPAALAQLLGAAGAPPVMTRHLTELFGYFRTGVLDLVTDDVTTLTGRPALSLTDFLAGPAGQGILGDR
jgi:uncharacterized protein YbjT (DUF2867 family)